MAETHLVTTEDEIKNNPYFMKAFRKQNLQSGKIGWALLWLIGVPVPLLLVFFVLRGCT